MPIYNLLELQDYNIVNLQDCKRLSNRARPMKIRDIVRMKRILHHSLSHYISTHCSLEMRTAVRRYVEANNDQGETL